MSMKISSEGTDTVSNQEMIEFLAYSSLEQQVFFCFNKCLRAQGEFNGSNPPSRVSRFGVVPNFSNKVANAQARLALSDSAVLDGLVSAVQSAGIGATKLDIASGDSVTNSQLNELLALSSLEKQLCWLVSLLSTRENQYNSTNTADQINRVTVAPNFDNNSVNFQVALPLSASADLPASAVEAYI